jgi:cytochrome bd-type quinol oxidase subunit 2
MVSLASYQLLHILGIVLVFMSLGGVSLHAINGGTRDSNRARALVSATHGLGLLLILVAGFGMLARLGEMSGGLPSWVWVKLLVWLTLAAAIVVPYRKPAWSKALWALLPLLALVAAYSALFRPG